MRAKKSMRELMRNQKKLMCPNHDPDQFRLPAIVSGINCMSLHSFFFYNCSLFTSKIS